MSTRQNSSCDRRHSCPDDSTTNLDDAELSLFRITTAVEAKSFTDGVRLRTYSPLKPEAADEDHDSKNVILPWMGFGTYRLGRTETIPAVLQALAVGYRAIDTAFIYGGEKTETLVGQAIQQAMAQGIIQSRRDVFITTKHWRNYHGYEPTLQCLNLSLRRLSVDYIDLYLMHWGGPAWSTMNREKGNLEQDPWHYATTCESDMATVRAETWRAMEDALRQKKVRSIGVSNFTVQHLQTLRKTATTWPPAVNQVEFQ
jgi:diketogulonate reductase-like aldo/keto reductase